MELLNCGLHRGAARRPTLGKSDIVAREALFQYLRQDLLGLSVRGISSRCHDYDLMHFQTAFPFAWHSRPQRPTQIAIPARAAPDVALCVSFRE